MSTSRTTASNPGAFQPHQVPGLLATARMVLHDLRARQPGHAIARSLVGVANAMTPLIGPLWGNRLECPCCGVRQPFFVHRSHGRRVVWNSVCPVCDARSRHRGLAALLPGLLAEARPRRVLHFAPEAVLRGIFQGRAGLAYETCDLYLTDVTHTGIDIQRLPFADGSYDLVLCNHVLEHVERDHAAMAELARILRPGGMAVITVPGDFRRTETIPFVGELPNGHHRDYGNDIVEPLRAVFASVEALDMHQFDAIAPGQRRSIRRLEVAWLCTK